MSVFQEMCPRTINEVTEPVDRGEVLRYLGYPEGVAPSDRVADHLDGWIDEAGRLASPRAIYVVLPVVEKDHRRLRLRSSHGVTEFRGAIGQFLGMSHMVGVFIATAGPDVERLGSELLHKGECLGAMVVGAVGAERAEAAEAAVIGQLRAEAERIDFAPTLPYSPGYCGMKLTEQTKLFALLDGETVGVALTPECMMQPIKSVSGLIGLGPSDEIQSYGSPCDRCELHNCNMRR